MGPGDVPQDAATKDSATDTSADGREGDAPAPPDHESGAEVGVEAAPDVTPDVVPDRESGNGDDGCSRQPIWPSNGAGFTYTTSGGFVAQPPPDAGCASISRTYQFAAGAMTLTLHGCEFTGPIDRTVYLTGGETAQILANVQALQTSCPTNNCGADYPNVVISIRTSAGQSTVYNSDFYAGCQGNIVAPPFVSYQSLGAFENLLSDIITAACQADGGTADAGTCVRGVVDGGVGDAGGAG